MDSQRSDIFRGAFGLTAAATKPAAPSAKSEQQVYDNAYKKFIAKGLSPKQAAAFAGQTVKRMKAAGSL